ncbi:hypothetical protein SGPA1_50391 [Streptomyces misionensis JCM 4497]
MLPGADPRAPLRPHDVGPAGGGVLHRPPGRRPRPARLRRLTGDSRQGPALPPRRGRGRTPGLPGRGHLRAGRAVDGRPDRHGVPRPLRRPDPGPGPRGHLRRAGDPRGRTEPERDGGPAARGGDAGLRRRGAGPHGRAVRPRGGQGARPRHDDRDGCAGRGGVPARAGRTPRLPGPADPGGRPRAGGGGRRRHLHPCRRRRVPGAVTPRLRPGGHRGGGPSAQSGAPEGVQPGAGGFPGTRRRCAVGVRGHTADIQGR